MVLNFLCRSALYLQRKLSKSLWTAVNWFLYRPNQPIPFLDRENPNNKWDRKMNRFDPIHFFERLIVGERDSRCRVDPNTECLQTPVAKIAIDQGGCKQREISRH